VPTPLVDSKGLCDQLYISRPTAKRLLDQGMPHFKIGPRCTRFDVQDVRQWLADRADSASTTPTV
jgi:predicted DNA-binding transcriptional regulator AlpA